MELIPEVLSKLTDTEKKIVTTYAKRGGSAKELAAILGVSERTVYKALYKYRKIAKNLGIDPSRFYLRQNLALSSSDNDKLGQGSINSKSIIDEIRDAILRDVKRIVEESVKEALREVLASQITGYNVDTELSAKSIARSDPTNHATEKLAMLLERLSYGIDKLNRNIEILSSKIDTFRYMGPSKNTEENSNGKNVGRETLRNLPSYVVDNPWLEVLSRK